MGSPFCSSAHKLLNNLSEVYFIFTFVNEPQSAFIFDGTFDYYLDSVYDDGAFGGDVSANVSRVAESGHLCDTRDSGEPEW